MTTGSFPHDNFSSVYWIFTKLGHMIPLWKGKTLFILGSLPLYRLIIYIDGRILWCTHFLFFWSLCCLSFDLRILVTPFGIFKLLSNIWNTRFYFNATTGTCGQDPMLLPFFFFSVFFKISCQKSGMDSNYCLIVFIKKKRKKRGAT